jgi:hypothetical protein
MGHWSMVNGHWSMVNGHWSMVIGQWSMVIGHWSLVGAKHSVSHLSLKSRIYSANASPLQGLGLVVRDRSLDLWRRSKTESILMIKSSIINPVLCPLDLIIKRKPQTPKRKPQTPNP